MIGKEKHKLVKGFDFILVLICILIAVFIGIYFFMSNKNQENISTVAVIKYDNNEIYRIDLNIVDEPYYIPIDREYHSKILVEKGKICFEEADCPDKVCVNTGKISKPGQVAVCLPAKLIIKIEGKEAETDAITG